MHLRCSKDSFYGEHSLMRPEALEPHAGLMQIRTVGLPFVSNGFVGTAEGIVPHQCVHDCCIYAGHVA